MELDLCKCIDGCLGKQTANLSLYHTFLFHGVLPKLVHSLIPFPGLRLVLEIGLRTFLAIRVGVPLHNIGARFVWRLSRVVLHSQCQHLK